MPTTLQSRTIILDRLMDTFRTAGYDGASLAELSSTTGLGKSSLYHHFPGGKSDMAVQVLQHLATGLERDLLAPLRTGGTPTARLDQMLQTLDQFYDHGRKPCLLERLAASVDAPRFAPPLQQVFKRWIGALQSLGESAGLSKRTAKARAEDVVVRVEGALIVAAGLGEPAVFTRTLQRIRQTLLQPE